MRLRTLGVLLLLLSPILLTAGAPPAYAQTSSEAELKALKTRVVALSQAGKYDEAIPLAELHAVAIKARHGESSPEYATAINDLAQLLKATNRLAEAEPLMRQALAIDEKAYGLAHPKVAIRRNNLAELLQATNHLTEAELLMRRALAIDVMAHGSNHLKVASDLNNLAQLLADTSRLVEAETLLRRALTIDEKAYGTNHPNVARDLHSLGQLLADTDRLAEAETLYRRAIAIDEKAYGPDHLTVATDINDLAVLFLATNRLSEAESLIRRALAIDEKTHGLNHPDVARDLNNLAQLLKTTNRLAEAEPLMRRALAIDQKVYGPGHPNAARDLNNLAQLLADTNRFAEAEPLMRRALAIDEKAYGPAHPKVAISLNNLARLLADTNHFTEAELLMRRALAIDEVAYGPNHPKVARDLNNLATLREEQNDWAGGAVLCLRAKPIMTGTYPFARTENLTLTKTRLIQNSADVRNCARALYRSNARTNLGEGFALAQWALQNAAADALNAMSLRFAKGDAQLAKIVRAEQDLLSDRTAAYRRLDVAVGTGDTKTAEAARTAIDKIEKQLAAKRSALRQDFPEYAVLTNPQPLSIEKTQAYLGERQALVLFLDLKPYKRVQEETLIFVLTKRKARWLSIPLGTKALWDRVMALRCGLDGSNWRQGQKSRKICKGLLSTKVAEGDQPPFDAEMAHALYLNLFSGIEDLTRGKSLLIVPSGPLTQLPFEVLVTAKPNKSLPRFEAYRRAAWLGQRQAITILPSVGSLKALHAAKSSKAAAPFIGFGNPLLTGASGNDKSTRSKQTCRDATEPRRTRVAGQLAGNLSLFRSGAVNVEALRKQPPLPETADELCAVAGGLGVPTAELDKSVYLGKRATVTQVKALSADGKLARARVVHFATHGLLAGETALFAKNHAEPALLLTPPAKASDEDNGLLTALEVAQLKLDADWVILSACNTAAGEGESNEALSGLARAFFYAGGRSLLVSHWPVDSQAAVELTTGAITAMQREPHIGRAEALRRSISALIAKGNGWDHPSIWAPFVLVGNGGQ